MTKYPVKIAPNKILESIIEIRFESKLPGEVIVGMIFEKNSGKYSDIVRLPILDIPQSLRDSEPSLRDKPHYRLQSGDFLLNVGARMIGLIYQPSKVGEYVGWDAFFKEFKDIAQFLFEQAVTKVNRVGIRYVDFFEGENVFENLKLNFDEPYKPSNRIYGVEIPDDVFTTKIQISDKSDIENLKIKATGSTIDIDCYTTNVPADFKEVLKIIESGHELSKKRFFDLLKDDYIEKLNPTY